MPAKPQSRKGKRATRSKRKGMRAVTAVQDKTKVDSPAGSVTPPKAVPMPAVSRREATPAVSYSYLVGDIKRIGLLALVMMVLLAVVYFVFS